MVGNQVERDADAHVLGHHVGQTGQPAKRDARGVDPVGLEGLDEGCDPGKCAVRSRAAW